jgi:hypothetical protein
VKGDNIGRQDERSDKTARTKKENAEEKMHSRAHEQENGKRSFYGHARNMSAY